MDYERIRDFIISYCHDDCGILQEIYDEALKDEVPIIRRDAKNLLQVMLRMIKPKRILEVGTAIGYSTLVMADTLNDIYGECNDWHITTLELDETRCRQAQTNFDKSSFSRRISLIRGDAADSLDLLEGQFDLVFIDAAKAQYMVYLEKCMKLVCSGTVILTDNILSDGDVLESHFLVEKRDRTIHDRMREYVYKIKNDESFDTAILSVGDGIAVSVVR